MSHRDAHHPPLSQPSNGNAGLSPRAVDEKLLADPTGADVLADFNLVVSSTTIAMDGQTLNDDDLLPTAQGAIDSFLVFPIRPRPDSHFDFVTVGRNPNNDIVLNDGTISYFHAYFPHASKPTVVDAGSSNGTYINDLPAEVKGSGRTTPFAAGDAIRLGNIRGTLFDRRQTLAFVRRAVARRS